MTVVKLGNVSPMMQVEGASVRAEHLNQSVTRIEMREEFDNHEHVLLTLSTGNDRVLSMIARGLGEEFFDYAVGVNEVEQIVGVHAGGTAPTWVCSDDKKFALALAKHFDCAVGEPFALFTTVGRDAVHAQHMSTAAQPASFNYMAISANATAPNAGNTTLPGEITTAGGGLLRAQATYAHTGGTNTSTLTKTFTANGSDSLPVTIAKIGILNAASVGTLGYETLLNATATLTISGDNVAITETVTAG